MRTKRWLVAAALAGVVAAAVLGMSGPAGASPEGGHAGLVVHEWGTFSSFSGSDGTALRFNPSNTDLPRFVHRTPIIPKDAYSGTVSLETPVLYFYSERPITATVRARFPAGVFTEWFPRADLANDGKALTWPDVRVRPGETDALPTAPGENHYYAARDVDAAPVEMISKKDRQEVRERERFLFYRGVGDAKPPLTVVALGGGAFAVRNGGDEAIPGGAVVEVKGGTVRFRPLGPIPPGGSALADLPAVGSSADPLRATLTGILVKAGLFEKEAKAMVRTWEKAWFGDDGTRVLYVLPTRWTDQSLPLQVTPKPDAIARVMVGRHDLLTPEREREIDTVVRQLHGQSA